MDRLLKKRGGKIEICERRCMVCELEATKGRHCQVTDIHSKVGQGTLKSRIAKDRYLARDFGIQWVLQGKMLSTIAYKTDFGAYVLCSFGIFLFVCLFLMNPLNKHLSPFDVLTTVLGTKE